MQLDANDLTRKRYGQATLEEVENGHEIEDRKNAIKSKRKGATLTKEQTGDLEGISNRRLTWAAPSKTPVSVSREEEIRVNDLEHLRESRRLMAPLVGKKEAEPLSPPEDDDWLLRGDDDRLGSEYDDGLEPDDDDRLEPEEDDRLEPEDDDRLEPDDDDEHEPEDYDELLPEDDDRLVTQDDEAEPSRRRPPMPKSGDRNSNAFDAIFGALIHGRAD